MEEWKKTALITGSCLLIAAMVAVWIWVDLGTADSIASVVGASMGAVGIAYPLFAGASANTPTLTARGTGKATSRNGGSANSGITGSAPDSGVAAAENTGDADADGDGDANTGIRIS
jgi:hypothetical protein